jgi:hypothetical protein
MRVLDNNATQVWLKRSLRSLVVGSVAGGLTGWAGVGEPGVLSAGIGLVHFVIDAVFCWLFSDSPSARIKQCLLPVQAWAPAVACATCPRLQEDLQSVPAGVLTCRAESRCDLPAKKSDVSKRGNILGL